MSRALVLALLLGSTGTCSSRPGEPPRAGDTTAAVATPTNAPTAGPCRSARCWLERADEAERIGAFDVAAAHRGRAYAAEPSAERLVAWVDALVAGGELRRAQEALEEARAGAVGRKDDASIAQIDARLAGLPTPAQARPSAGLSAALRAAYEAEAAGRLEDAASAFARALADDPDPAHLVHAGELQWTRGQPVEARRLWSRARAQVHERGGAIEVVPVETWFTSQMLWQGDQLALVRRFTPALDIMARPAGALDLQPARPGAPATRRLRFARPPGVVAFSDDGRTLVRDEEGVIVLQDMSSGEVLRRITTGAEAIGRLAVVGAGEAMFVLAAHREEASLWSARGEPIERFRLSGTTPTITRVYTGEGTHHDNILRDSPTWPVSLALTADAGLVAIGGSDSKVRLFDRKRGRRRELAFAWHYTERRPMGGNPDLNLPLDMRFVAGGAELVVVHTHGDLLRWDTGRGALVKHIPGTCSAAEARRVVNRYTGPGEPQREATDDERRGCGHAVTASLAPDGARVATGGGLQGIRVREVATGAAQVMLVAQDLPDRYLALSGSGALAGSNLYGAVTLLPAGQDSPTQLVPPHASGPTDPWIAPSGRHMHFQLERETFAWDLVDRRRLELTGPKEELLALAPAGDYAAVHTGDAVEVRDVATRTARFRAPTRYASHYSRARFTKTSGHVFLDIEDEKGRAAVVVALPSGASTPVRVSIDQQQLWFSDDGRWLATARHDQPLKIWRVATGELVATLDDQVRQVAFAPDGAFVVWLRQVEARKPGGRARLRWLDEPARSDMPEAPFSGWGEHVAVAPAGDEVMILAEDGRVTRWRPSTGARAELQQTDLVLSRRVQYADDGKTLLLVGYGRVDIRANDAALTPIAAVAPLLSGGWLARSHAGAFDGSEDAPAHLIARVQGAGDELVHDGRLVWDAVHVPGVVARALAGEDVAPPLPLAPAPAGPGAP